MDQNASSIEKVRDALRSSCVFSVDDHTFAVFFKGELQHVVSLNASAEALVRLSKSAGSKGELVADYADVLDVPVEIARQFVSIICEDWTEIGIIGPDKTASGSPEFKTDEPPARGHAPFDSVVSIGGSAIKMILHDSDLAKLAAPMVAGNSVTAPPDPVFTINAWKAGAFWHVTDSAGKSETVTTIAVARDRTLARLMANSWPNLIDAPCIHGATLRAPNGQHIMLSGDSGRGKSTLALGLGRQSFTLLADDMSVFDAGTGRVYPIKTNPSVKAGSWAALGPLYPELAQQEPIDVNGRLCKYVRRASFEGPEPPHSVDALIFPTWRQGAQATLEPYDNRSSLLSMLRWSYLPQHQENLQAMADFLGSLPLYELTYSRFEDADRILMDLLECRN